MDSPGTGSKVCERLGRRQVLLSSSVELPQQVSPVFNIADGNF